MKGLILITASGVLEVTLLKGESVTMDPGQSLYFLRELILRFQQAANSPGDRALCEHGKVALHTVFEVMGMPPPTPDMIQVWRDYADQIRRQHEPAGRTVASAHTPHEEYIGIANEIIAKCDQLRVRASSDGVPEEVGYADALSIKAANMRDWIIRAQKVTPKMETALTNMLDGVGFKLAPKTSERQYEDDTPF